MNILHIIPSFFPAWRQGGPIEWGHRLCRGVAEAGCHVRVLTTDSNGLEQVLDVEKDQEVKMADFLSVRYCRRLFQESVSPTLLRCVPSYVRWADVVHLTAVYSFPTIPALFFSKMFRKPVVWSPQGSLQRWEGSSKRSLKTLWEQICFFLAPEQLILHATSEEEAKESQKSLPRVKTVIIPYGVEVPKEINHVPRNGLLRIGFLGRLDPKKGIENLLTSCELLRGYKNFPFMLTVGGSGNPSYTKSIENMIEKFRLNSCVKMIGHIEGHQREQFFGNIDILVVPSYTESFCLVVAEALAHSVPVIASKSTPWKQLEKVGCGLWVSNDAESLATAITQMSQMPLLEMGRQGQEWMEKEFSWPCVTEKMIQLYQNLLIEIR